MSDKSMRAARDYGRELNRIRKLESILRPETRGCDGHLLRHWNHRPAVTFSKSSPISLDQHLIACGKRSRDNLSQSDG